MSHLTNNCIRFSSNIYLHLECEPMLELAIVISRNPLIHWVINQIIFTLLQHRFMVWKYCSMPLLTQSLLAALISEEILTER